MVCAGIGWGSLIWGLIDALYFGWMGLFVWVDMVGGNKAKFGHYRGLRIDF